MENYAYAGVNKTPVKILDFGSYPDGSRYAVCYSPFWGVNINILLELLTVEA